MDNDRPAPPITISDPRGGVLTTDLLAGGGPEPEPWHPTLTQLVALVVAVLVAGIASVPVLMVQQRHRDAAADRAELAAISLVQTDDDLSDDASGAGVSANGQVVLRLTNDGPTVLRVLSAHVDRSGYAEQAVSATLQPGGQGSVRLRPLGACPPLGAIPADPSGVVVTVRTPRGQRATVRVPVGESVFSQTYATAIQVRCRAFPLEDSIVAGVSGLARTTDRVTGVLALRNRSREPHTLSELVVGQGLGIALGRPLPLVLPPAPAADVDVRFSISVSACRLGETQMTAGTDPERAVTDYSFEGPSFGGIEALAQEGPGEPFLLTAPADLSDLLGALVTDTCGPH